MEVSRSPDNADSDSETEPVSQNTGMASLSTLGRTVSPPPIKRATKPESNTINEQSLAAIEAGQAEITNHLETISANLKQCVRSTSESTPCLSISNFMDLYRRNEHDEGCHFVIHQHDHPVAGPHYDLRLQFSKTSSVSWSIMYGLPGDPNSQKLNRNATETRIHCLWNHLLETASLKTGSLIIWDTGEYEILPYEDESQPETDDSRSECSDHSISPKNPISNSARLQQAFKNRKIRLRLHGTRLPKNYTIALRMDKSTDYARPIRKGPKRRRKGPASSKARAPSTSDSEISEPESSPRKVPEGVKQDEGENDSEISTHSDDDIDLQIQLNNAYPGSTNTIGSIHTRRWWVSIDRESSGFERRITYDKSLLGSSSRKSPWVRSLDRNNILQGFEPFYVRGPDAERSVVTGRLGNDVLSDEKVDGFVPRKGWRAVLK